MSRKDDRVPREEYEKLIRELEVVVDFFLFYFHDRVIILSFDKIKVWNKTLTISAPLKEFFCQEMLNS